MSAFFQNSGKSRLKDCPARPSFLVMLVFLCSDCSSDAVTTAPRFHSSSFSDFQFGQPFEIWQRARPVSGPRCALRTGTSDDFETFDGIGLTGLIFHLIGMFKNVRRFFQLRLLLDDARSYFLAPRHRLSWRHGLCRSRIQGVIIQRRRHSDRTPEPVLHAEFSTHNQVTANQVK